MGRRTETYAPMVAIAAGVCAVLGMAQWSGGDRAGGDTSWTLVLTLAYAPAGALLARRAPVVAWVFLGIAASSAVALLAGEHASAVAEGRAGVGGAVAVWASRWSWVPGYVLLAAVVPAVLPDGRSLPGRWRWVPRAGVVTVVVSTVAWAVTPYDEVGGPSDAALALGATNPVGVAGAGVLVGVALLLTAACAVAALVTLGVRWRRSRDADRTRLAWVLTGAVVTLLLLALAHVFDGVDQLLLLAAAFPLPVSVAVSVLRHGMWDPQLALRRSLVWLLLSVAVAAAFVVIVAVLGRALGARTGAPVVAAAVVALAVAPVRDRLQAAVSRLLYGAGADPYEAVSRLSTRLADVATPQAALEAAAAEVAAALRLPAVRIAVADGPVADHGDGTLLGPESHRVPLVHAGQRVGEFVVAPRDAGVPLRRVDLRLLERLAAPAGAAAHAARLDAQLARSRGRLAAAREEERRRIRLDLHDSLGPTLAAVALQLERLPDLVATDPDAARVLAARLTGRVQGAVAQVRAIVDGLGAENDLGLAEALRAQVDAFDAPALRAALRIDGVLDGLPAAVETVAVRVVGEALANAVRHSGAGACAVDVTRSPAELVVVVRDDGIGLSAARGGSVRTGVGIASMASAAAEVGGTCTVADAAGGGTEVRLVVPL